MALTHQRWFELVAMFLLVPLIALYFKNHLMDFLLPLLFLLMLLCVYFLVQDQHFKRKRFFNIKSFKKSLTRISRILFFGGIFSMLFYHYYQGFTKPITWFELPISATKEWLMLLLLYPLLSVLPQELIFRTYFFHRFKLILPNKNTRIFFSALLFGFAHIVYTSWIAVLLATIGGLLFAYTYAYTRSTLAIVVEHSLWGLWLFSMGLGQYLDAGAIV